MDPTATARSLLDHYRRKIGAVDESLSPNDQMMDGEEHYRAVGESTIRHVRLALLAADRDPDSIQEILDLPCGHGRELRYLQRQFPQARITACDIDRDGVDFCAKAFGSVPVYGNVEPLEVEFPHTYDLLWCGSLMTHLPAPKWREFLQSFERVMNPGGIVIFTQLGRQASKQTRAGWDYYIPKDRLLDLARQYRTEGFGYVDYEGTTGYGVSAASPTWTLRLIQEFQQFSVLYFREWGWDDHQDVIALVKQTHEGPKGPKQGQLDDVDWGPSAF